MNRHVLLLPIWIFLVQSSHLQTTTTIKVQGMSLPHRIYPLGMPPLALSARTSKNHDASSVRAHTFPHDGEQQPYIHPTYDQDNIRTIVISSKCSCGSLHIDVPIRYGPGTIEAQEQQEPHQVDCHCPACRRYHVSGLVRFLEVKSGITVMGDTAVRFRDSCNTLGTVDRMYCRRCMSKLLTTRVPATSIHQDASANQQRDAVYVNMGPIDDSTVPDDLAEYWKRRAPVTPWNANLAVSWATAKPHHETGQPEFVAPTSRSSGGCTCGACQYDYRLEAPMEIQHCYCYLCRQLSGGMFMSWVPIKARRQRFQWDMTSRRFDSPLAAATDESGRFTAGRRGRQGRAPQSHRYTNIGERHTCTSCGGVISILYDFEDSDDEPATIWLAAGGFDSIRFPFRIEPYLSRAVHICCRYKPKFYELPDDGLEKIPYAS